MSQVKASLYEVTGPGKWDWQEDVELEMIVPETRVNHPDGTKERGRTKVCLRHGTQVLEIPLADLRRALGELPQEAGRGNDEPRPRLFH